MNSIIIVFVFSFSLALVIVLSSFFAMRKTPVLSFRASVKSKFQTGGGRHNRPGFYVVFESIDDTGNQTLLVPIDKYGAFSENEVGMLSYKKTNKKTGLFIDFEKQS